MLESIKQRLIQLFCSHPTSGRKARLWSGDPAVLYGDYVVTYCGKCGKELSKKPTSNFNGAVSSKNDRRDEVLDFSYEDSNFGYDLVERLKVPSAEKCHEEVKPPSSCHHGSHHGDYDDRCRGSYGSSGYSSSDSGSGSSSSCSSGSGD